MPSRPGTSRRSDAELEWRIAYIVIARSAVLLRTHSRKLRRSDLEECLSQAAFELIRAGRNGRSFECDGHIASSFDQRFLSRVADQQRALSGRSPRRAELERALSTQIDRDAPEGLQHRAAGTSLEETVFARDELAGVLRAARRLTADERIVVGSRLGVLGDRDEICAQHGWSPEKYRKLAQRGRDRLRRHGEFGSLPTGGNGEPR